MSECKLLLQFLLNAGLVVLGLYVAAKVFQVDIGGINSSQQDNEPRQRDLREGKDLPFLAV